MSAPGDIHDTFDAIMASNFGLDLQAEALWTEWRSRHLDHPLEGFPNLQPQSRAGKLAVRLSEQRDEAFLALQPTRSYPLEFDEIQLLHGALLTASQRYKTYQELCQDIAGRLPDSWQGGHGRAFERAVELSRKDRYRAVAIKSVNNVPIGPELKENLRALSDEGSKQILAEPGLFVSRPLVQPISASKYYLD